MYGTKAEAYFSMIGLGYTGKVAGVIAGVGGAPDFGWYKDFPNRFSVPVQHFKGYHWDE